MLRRMWRFGTALVLVVTVGSCGDDGGGESTATTDRPSTTAAPTTIAPPVPADPPTIPIADRLEQRFEVIGGPDWLVAAAGSVWVKADDGRVVRVDPATNEVVAEVPIETTDICQGIGGDDVAIWTCHGGDLVRIDPATDEVAATVAVDKFPDNGHLPVVDGRVWVLTGDGDVLAGIADDAVDVEVDLGALCTELTGLEGAVWVSCLGDDSVIGVDVATGEVRTRVTGLPTPRTLTASGSDVWVSYEEGLARIDTEAGAVVGVVDASTGATGGLAATPSTVWARTGGFLRQVDATSLDVVEDVSFPEESGGDVIVAFGSLWTTASNDAVLYRLTCGAVDC